METAGPSGLDNLTYLGLRSGVDMRPTLLRVLTDLYVQKLTHTPDEERHYTELALRLLDAVDVPTRAAVAARLARHLSPPLRVIRQLAADLPEVAAPVRGHPILHRKTPISEPVIPASPVAEVQGPAVPELAENLQEEAPPPGFIATDVASELNEIFFTASAEERRLILLNIEIAAPLPARSIRLERDANVGRQLEAAALARNREDFAQQLAHALEISLAQARRIASDVLGEPIVVAAKAIAMPRDVVYRILLFVNTSVGHSVERVHTLAALHDELPMQAAEHMVAIWQSLHRQEPAKHRPLLWNDEARARARTATAAVRRAPASRSNERREVS
ncbi:MAG TPA: hypothetical protein VL048_04135 [Xanthobacteraceae bacterium]|nr:hypothetical protein [Xanthobacteraceae bacterium]